jgi:hypothetical protein
LETLRGRATMEELIDRRPGLAFASLTVVYAAAIAGLSHVKLLWLDELITLHIARLGNSGAIWNALARGADPNPPATHLLVHWSRMLFGDHELADRLPAALGYWVGMLSLFAYLRRRLPGTWALGGTVLSLCMAGFDYSYESRSYGIFYGLAMLAFLCWSWTVDPRSGRGQRIAALAGMAVALACGISTNYFAVLAFVPIAVGEAVRTWERQRDKGLLRSIDWRIWIATGVAAAPLLLYRPLIDHAIARFAPYAWNKVSLDAAFDSYTEMVEIILYPLLALFVVAIGMAFVERRVARMCPECRERVVPRWMEPMLARRGEDVPQGLKPGIYPIDGQSARLKSSPYAIPTYEAAGAFCFMAYPFIGYAIATIRGGMLSPRFVIPVCFGFAIAGALAAFRLFGNMRRAGVVFLMFVSAWFVCRESVVAYWYAEQKDSFYKVLDELPHAEEMLPANAPIVIPDPLLALAFQHYAPPAQAARAVFAVDFPAVRAFRGDDSPEENLWAGRGYLYTLPIETVAEFEKQGLGTEGLATKGPGTEVGEGWEAPNNGDYLILAGKPNWLLRDLRLHHYEVERLPLETHASEIGGFTPLAHGKPEFYAAHWGGEQALAPVPFRAEDDTPSAKALDTSGDTEGGKP